jgi:hypothetical protein
MIVPSVTPMHHLMIQGDSKFLDWCELLGCANAIVAVQNLHFSLDHGHFCCFGSRKPVAVVATLFGERKAPDGTPLGH